MTHQRCSFIFAIYVSMHISLYSQPAKHTAPPLRAFGSAQLIQSTILKENNITTIEYNYGSISRPGIAPNVLDFVWKGLGYAYEMGLLFGAEVKENGNTYHIVSEGFWSLADGEYGPDGTKWGWLPIAGYSNPNQSDIARSDDPATWDASWTSWHGKYKNGAPIADLETVYGMDDATKAGFPYYPSPSDTSRRGLGIQAEVRTYQFRNPNLADVLFFNADFKNVSEKNLTKAVAGLFYDPHVGGANDYADDRVGFDSLRSLVYNWDYDGKGSVPGITPGYFSSMTVETPLDSNGERLLGMTSFWPAPYGGNFRPKNDTLMWNDMTPGTYSTELLNSIQDFVILTGSGYFKLDTGKTVSYNTAFVLADNFESLLSKANIALLEYERLFTSDTTLAVAFISPTGNQVVNGTIDVHWTAKSLDSDTTIELYYSNTYDQQWHLIAKGITNAGTYSWNTLNVPDGIFYKLHIINRKLAHVGYDSTGFFTVNNPGDAAPQIALVFPDTTNISGNVHVNWLAGDPENDPVTVSIYLSLDNGGTYSLLGEQSNTGAFNFDSKQYPNNYTTKIKLVASANSKSSSVESGTFFLRNYYDVVGDSAFTHSAGRATGKIFPSVVDSTQLSGHNYQVTFDSANGSLAYSVKDLTTNTMKLSHEPLASVLANGKIFDGMRLSFQNNPTEPDSSTSGFTNGDSTNVDFDVKEPTIGYPLFAPFDVKVTFNRIDTTNTGAYQFPGDSLSVNTNLSQKVPTPFHISNITDTTTLKTLVVDLNKNSRWDFGEKIVLLTPPPYAKKSNNTMMEIDFYKTTDKIITLHGGEEFIARTTKSFALQDVYEFTASKEYMIPSSAPQEGTAPLTYILYQNYPNPFNPQTRIRFSLAQKNPATLIIYDILGREVRTLINGTMEAGAYEIMWDGNNQMGVAVASGMYIYRLQSGTFAQTRKMMLVR